ncbi:MAG: C40 family peptidase [Firmicutes bacterium]|nr:C40 family peptidase [Bacillota bacterium]
MKHKITGILVLCLLTGSLYGEAAAAVWEAAGEKAGIGKTGAAGIAGAMNTAEAVKPVAEVFTKTGELSMAGGIGAELMPPLFADSERQEPGAADAEPTESTVREQEAGGAAPAEGAPASEDSGIEAGAPIPEEEPENEYADLAIADVRNYVNVRTGPDTGSSIVGKIYDGAVAQILETVDGEDGEWFRVVSGNVEGYIKSEFFLYGAAAAEVIDDHVTRYAVVLATRLNVRENPDVETKRIGYIDKGEKVRILENLGDWLKVQYTRSKTGYVAAEYVTVTEEFVYAKTLEEEAAELAAKKALEQRQNVSEAQAAESTEITVTPPSGEYSTNEELRGEIVAYAMQFLGNRYVHGGQSLETGTDCSGFTSLVYAAFGYSVSRTPAGQLSGAGRSVSYSEARPGDIICYGSRRCTHVALYIGDGQIIHAANSRKGVIIQEADYDNILGVKNLID